MKPVKTIHGAVILLFGLFFLAPGLFMGGLYFRGFQQWWAARSWEETPCRIESAELKVSRGDDSTSYRVIASYRYEYQGMAHHGDKVGFSSSSDNVGDFQKRAYRELASYVEEQPAKAEAAQPSARAFRCYVNPANPDQAVLYRELRWEMQAFMAIFALTFPAVGAGVAAFGLASMRRLRQERRLQAAHPDAPWRWQPQWAGAAIPEAAGKWRVGIYAYTLWATAVVASLLVGSGLSGAFSRGGSVWLLLIYPALWCIPAWLSLRQFRRRAAVGAARLELKTLPVAPGGLLEGEVVIGKAVKMLAGAETSLVCERRITVRHGDKSSISTETVWSQDEAVGAGQIIGDVGYCRIPVRFVVPVDAPVSGPEAGKTDVEVNWKLKLKAPGTAVETVFEVPVFRDPNAPIAALVAATPPPSIRAAQAAKLPELLKAQRLVADFDAQDRLRSLVSPPARHRALTGFLLVFNLVWTAVAVVLIQQQAPLPFRIAWPLSAALIWLVIGWQLLHRRTITMADGGLDVRNQLGPAQWRIDLPHDRIAGYSFDSNMQSNNRPFYRVRVKTLAGKQHTLLGGISEVAAAEALVDHLEMLRKT